MTPIDHSPIPDPAGRSEVVAQDTATTSHQETTRIQAIHELVRSGSYYVPASAIADRMLKRILVDGRDTRS